MFDPGIQSYDQQKLFPKTGKNNWGLKSKLFSLQLIFNRFFLTTKYAQI